MTQQRHRAVKNNKLINLIFFKLHQSQQSHCKDSLAILRVLQENGVQSAAGTEILRSQGGLEGMEEDQAVGPKGPECQVDQGSRCTHV